MKIVCVVTYIESASKTRKKDLAGKVDGTKGKIDITTFEGQRTAPRSETPKMSSGCAFNLHTIWQRQQQPKILHNLMILEKSKKR